MRTISIILAVLTFIVMCYVTQSVIEFKDSSFLTWLWQRLTFLFWIVVSFHGCFSIWREITKNIKE